MPLGEYLTGLLFYIPTVGAALAIGLLIIRRFYGHPPALVRTLAFAMIATAALLFASLAPAVLGILSRPAVLVAAVVALGFSIWITRGTAGPERDRDPPPPQSGLVAGAVAAATVGLAVVYSVARLADLATQPIIDIDMLGFHLPGIARFIQTGTIWNVEQFLPGFATAQYPNNGDFLILSQVLPWRDLAFVRYLPVAFFGLTGVGAYALGLELRASRAAAATMAAAAVMVPALTLLAFEGLPDAISLATLMIGLVFLVRHVRHGHRGDLVLAGVSLGLSFGTKWYTTTTVGIVFVVWLLAGWLARRRGRAIAWQGLLLLAMILLFGGIWLLRNVIESGNPVYPKAVSLAGLHLFAGSRGDVIDLYGYTIAHYLGSPHILRTYIYPGFKSRVGITGLVLLAGLVVAAAAGIRGRRGERRLALVPAILLALAIVVIAACAEYAVTPGSAYGLANLPVEAFVNIRWLMPAMLIGAALAARAVVELRRVGSVLELGALAGVIDAIGLDPGVSARSVAIGVGVAVLLAIAVVSIRRGRPAAWRARPGYRVGLGSTAAVAGAVVALAAAERALQVRFDGHSYAPYDPTFAWIDAHASSGNRIGVTGVWSTTGMPPTLPAFGPRLGNEVSYVGVRVRHSLHLPPSRGEFDAALRHGRYDLLLVGLQNPDHTGTWAQQAGFRLVAVSPRLALYSAGFR